MNMVADAVVVEPVSTPISQLTGKRTGNSRKRIAPVRQRPGIRRDLQRLRGEFPTPRSRELFPGEQGILAREQGRHPLHFSQLRRDNDDLGLTVPSKFNHHRKCTCAQVQKERQKAHEYGVGQLPRRARNA